MKIHVKRPVHETSAEALDFRHDLPVFFTGSAVEVQLPSADELHTTVWAGRRYNPEIATRVMDSISLGQPSLSNEPFAAHIVNVATLGRSEDGNFVSLGAIFEPDEHFKQDKEYYGQLLPGSLLFREPHVTIAKFYGTHKIPHEVADWTREKLREVRVIQLGQVCVNYAERSGRNFDALQRTAA